MAIDLAALGLNRPGTVHHNLPAAVLIEHAVQRGEGKLAAHGALVAITGRYTGRSPDDKFIVRDDETAQTVWWGKVNKATDSETFARLHGRVSAYLQGRDLFVQDCYAGADPTHRLRVRVVCERAWHSAFARNMFIQPDADALADFEPEFTVLHAPGFKAVPAVDSTHSEAGIFVDFTRRMVLICGTEYAGEVKKSIFTVLNYLLPARGVLGMHCSANVGDDGGVAVFFGLSGTGKTTLSADPERALVGDDEHGWSDDGVFNFEGGCYAKVIRLDPEAEPVIFETTRRFGTLLENVEMDDATRTLDLASERYTENTRASYDISLVPNAVPSGRAGHPRDIVMLTCDAFGVLPPLSRMTADQAMYHFLAGYTAKVAGTERGVTEPTAAFSACFGAPFMARHPGVYARILGERIAQHGVRCWLLNTGWTGGPYGTGKRMSIRHTRALLRAALSGELNDARFVPDPIFKVAVPAAVPGVPDEVLQPRRTWADPAAYDAQAAMLVQRFHKAFADFADGVDAEVLAAQPELPALI
ncbi:MAG: phosphoenolpyruvate carboxykinase [Deltaproteobacteria bacterium]|nr:phosphoenolpyruvate carboxykinase [Deltaproteobacteria bacterium]